MCCVLCAVYCVLCTVCGVRCAACCVLRAARCALHAVWYFMLIQVVPSGFCHIRDRELDLERCL